MFDKVVKSTVPGQVVDQIKHLLANGALSVGDRLPPERQMSEQLGVSRPSLREALRVLEYAGVLAPFPGGGMRVTDGSEILPNSLQMTHLVKQFALHEMIEARKIIEAATVRLAIERASSEDIESIAKYHHAAYAILENKQAFVEADSIFHRALAEASGNGILVTMLQTMSSMMCDVNSELLSTLEGRKIVMDHHQLILDALARRDVPAGLQAMDDHLSNVVRTMQAQMPN